MTMFSSRSCFRSLLWAVVLTCHLVHCNTSSGSTARKLVIGVDGGTESIRACCFDALTGQVVGQACASPYATHHPQPGWAEQNPRDWYKQLRASVRGAIESLKEEKEEYELCAICMDTTCCSVVCLDKSNLPLRPALLWMDARSAPQTQEIMDKCKGNPALDINCGGEGPLSAEWMTPKALWVHQNEPEVWQKATTICEYQDYLNYQLTGRIVASSCNAATRWHWNGEECINNEGEPKGRPLSLYETLGIPELAQKLPQQCLPMGALVGHLQPEAAQFLNLPEGLPVVQGGADAFVGMIGLGCIHPGQMCLITGSSHLHCVVTSKPATSPGVWGAYPGAPLPGLNFAEGGQSSTGSVARWAKSKLFGVDDALSYKALDDEASKVPPGCEGLVALSTFQGARTPVTDPLARGALVGLTLSHTRAHVWRALLESVCFGTRACVEGLANAGHKAEEIVLAGGATRSPLWLQMHADISGLPVVVCENGDAPLLGCAVLASVGVGIHKDVDTAVQAMVRRARTVDPDPKVSKTYSTLYDRVYTKLVDSARPVAHAIADLRGGGGPQTPTKPHPDKVISKSEFWCALLDGSLDSEDEEEEKGSEPTTRKAVSPSSARPAVAHSVAFLPRGGGQQTPEPAQPTATRRKVTSPSLLAADWSDIKGAVASCIQAKASRLHVDIFDGVFLDSPHALTFGPQMVKAIRKSCDSCTTEKDARAVLDLHMCVHRPLRYVEAMADAGGDRFIFQWEAMRSTMLKDNHDQLKRAIELATAVVDSGMQCGVSINPETKVDEIYSLLETGLVDLVDILAVEPGFGGQKFQSKILQKVSTLNQWRDKTGREFDILVDGGINQETAPAVLASGADILVAGTFLFQHPRGLEDGVKELLAGFDFATDSKR